MKNTLKLELRPRLELQLGDDKTYTVEYPIPAVIAAETSLGRSLKSLSEWFELKWQDIAHVLHAGMSKHHPEVTLEEVKTFCDDLGAEGVLAIRHALICLNFPITMGAVAKRQAAGSPNVPSAGGQ